MSTNDHLGTPAKGFTPSDTLNKLNLWKSQIHHFEPTEFDSPDLPGSGLDHMNVAFVAQLDILRERCGFPFKIHSGYRTPSHNATVGGVDSSAHEAGLAADVEAVDSTSRFRIIQNALSLGFARIGIGNSFVHLDVDPSKAQNVVWLYPPTSVRA